MKLYENKREVELAEVLVRLFMDNVPNHNFEYMISYEEVDRVTRFGKAWTKKDINNWGKLTPKLFIHQEYAPIISYGNKDLFLIDLFREPGMNKYFYTKKFHIWEEIK